MVDEAPRRRPRNRHTEDLSGTFNGRHGRGGAGGHQQTTV